MVDIRLIQFLTRIIYAFRAHGTPLAVRYVNSARLVGRPYLSYLTYRNEKSAQMSQLVFDHAQVLTKDSVTVSVDAVVYYRVSNATVSVANVENAHHSTRLLAQTTLRNVLGTKNLSEILAEREQISSSMQVL